MSTTSLVILIAVILVAVCIAWFLIARERTRKLRGRFGPEYTRTMEEYGNQRKAERALLDRQKRVEKLQIHPLSDSEREAFAQEWRNVQTMFVDDPTGSIREADQLVGKLMDARGYPMSDFDHRVEDVSVDHPSVVQNYRAAHEIAQRADRQQANTEDLRRALVHYRDLFDELLEVHSAAPGRTR
jgi:hypothetical protein